MTVQTSAPSASACALAAVQGRNVSPISTSNGCSVGARVSHVSVSLSSVGSSIRTAQAVTIGATFRISAPAVGSVEHW